MSLIDWKVESQRFDGVASQYDTYRPTYPAELIEAILQYSNIQKDESILEIGSGTGKATILFAKRGYSILCLEPGQNLIDVAQQNLNAYPNVQFIKSRFEEWDALQKFDLVIFAQSFHWIPEAVRYAKTASAIKPKGHLAILYNMYPGMENEIGQELDEVYKRVAPEISRTNASLDELIQSRADSMSGSPFFHRVIVKKHLWSVRYETDAYLGLLNTNSDHLRLSEQTRSTLFKEIARVIERNGGAIEKPYLGVVYLAQRTSA